jgi:hypothetical protein
LTVPRVLARPGSFLLDAPPLQSSLASIPARFFRSEDCLPEVSSLIATSPTNVYNPRGFLGPHYVPSTGFLNLSTVYSAHRLVSLFHLTATYRVQSVQGLLSPHSLSSLIGRSCPHAVKQETLTDARPVAMLLASSFEALLRTKQRCRSPELTFLQPAPLFGFPSPPGCFRFPSWVPVTRDHPLTMLPHQVFACALALRDHP